MFGLTPQFSETILIALGSLVFNAGGFFWLAFNHFRTINAKMDHLMEEVSELKSEVAFIKGRCTLHTEDDE